ncbi:hypothetical protein V6N13_105724 [Hibiscus sabdariffa]|uniref:Photosystem I subunit X n=1 Tax=Hibiscus sabdariffa TaxID=183260 RepID=A0ABR2EYJ4_9ROSI
MAATVCHVLLGLIMWRKADNNSTDEAQGKRLKHLVIDHIMVTSTTLMLFAGRFELAPSANKKATTGLKLEARDSDLQTSDSASFTITDTLACGTVGHIIGVGVILSLKNIGAL